VALAVNDLHRIQIAPVNFSGLDDIIKQARLVIDNKAVILSLKELAGRNIPVRRRLFIYAAKTICRWQLSVRLTNQRCFCNIFTIKN